MEQHDDPREADWKHPAPRCNWCGKPEVKLLWSGERGQYCSFRCSAAGTYPRSVVIAFAMSGITAILFLIVIIMQSNHPNTPLPPVFGVLLAVPVIVSVSFIYMAYVGRMIRKKERLMFYELAKTGPKMVGPAWIL